MVKLQNPVRKLWWIPLVTGLLSIALGVWTLCAPAESIPILAYVFTFAMLAAGVLNLSYSIFAIGAPNWGWSMALGIIEIIAGIWMLSLPEMMLVSAFMFIVGIWIMVVAINSLCESCVMSAYSGGWIWWMILLLIATIALSIIFLSGPVAGGIVVWLWLGISFITFGLFRIILSVSLKKFIKS